MRRHLACPICLGLYKSPKILPCIHSFCDSCLNEYIKRTHTVSHIFAQFECPVCRASTSLGRYSGIDENSNTGWTKKFPLNHQLVGMVDDLIKSQGTSQSTIDELNEKCQPCFAAGRGVIASYMCVNCFEFMCDGCQLNHKLFTPIKNHTMLKKDDLPSDKSMLKRLIKLGKCKEHPDKEIEFKKDSYGSGEFQCITCLTDNSRYSSRISCLDKKEDNCETAMNIMGDLKHQIVSVMREKMLDCKRLKDERDDKQNVFSEFILELKDKVESTHGLLKGIQRHAHTEVKKIKDSIRNCQKLEMLANEEITFIETVAKYGSNVHGVVLAKDIAAEERRLKQSLIHQSKLETVFFDEFMLQEEGEFLGEIREIIDKRLYTLPVKK